MINAHLLTMQHSRRQLAKTQNELLASVFVKSIADSFVSIYVPIYLYTHGVDLRDVFLYGLVVYLTLFVALTIGLKACQFFGVKKIFVVGTILTALFYWLLHSLAPHTSYLAVAMIDGVALGFYFAAYNLLLTRGMARSKEGKNYAVLQVVGMLAGAIGPFIGSLCIKQLSFQDLFIVVVCMLAISPVPLLFSKGYHIKKEPLQLRQLLRGNSVRKRIDRSVFLQGFLYAAGSIWPLFLYVHYPHIVALGAITSLTGLAMIVMTVAVGKYVDRSARGAYRFGALIYAPTWLARLFFVTPVGLGLNACAASVLAIVPTMAVAKDIFHIAKKSSNRSAHFVRIEFYMDLGRIIAFGLGFITANMSILFVGSSLIAFAYLSCVPSKRTRRLQTAQQTI